MKIFRNASFAVLNLVVSASCSSDDDDNVTPDEKKCVVQVVLRSTMSNQPVTYEASNQASPLNLEEEYINIAEIEFEFDVFKDEKKNFANLLGDTIYASGAFILGEEVIPFIIKSDEELEVELEYENKPLVLDGEKSKVFIDLNINEVVLELIKNAAGDFAGAKIEEDGPILIDKDTNKNILEKFEEALEAAFEAIEDAHEKDN